MMSDDEENSSNDNSDSDDDFSTAKPSAKKTPTNTVPTVDDVDEDDDVEESEAEDEYDEEEDYEDDLIKGGAKKDAPDDSDVDDNDSDVDNIANEFNPATAANYDKKNEPSSNYNTTDEDTDADEEDETYLQKFDREISKNYVNDFHPECFNHNYDEILCLTKIVRDDSNIIIDPFHKTIPYLTKYERARVLGQRAKQIEYGATPFVKVGENVIEPHIIAELELEQKKIPFIIRRPLPNGSFEYWNLKDLEILIY